MDTGDEECSLSEAPAGTAKGKESMIEIKPDLEQLRAYTQTKLALAGQLRMVREALRALGRESGERQCGELLVKLAEDRFTLAVLGQFKRGKSSLMNAIIGRELLPTGVLPLTSAITVLKYGPEERLEIRHDGLSFPEELPVAALPEYVTEKGNPANQKKVKAACLELPVPFLRRGIEFVDTPGVGSALTANTELTYGFLPECDAVLFVTSVDTPLTSLELEFLKKIREYVDKIFFVLNKTDLVADGEKVEILEFVTKIIRSQMGCDVVKVFPVSARLGLTARISGDSVRYEQSGIKNLEEALASFLSGEKSVSFLAAVARKGLRVIDDEAGQGAFGEAALQARAREMQNGGFVTFRRDLPTAVAAAIEASKKLETLYANMMDGRMAEVTKAEASLRIAVGNVSAQNTFATPPATDMEADLRARSCPVCRHITEQASDFLVHWQYQIGTEERAQVEFAMELGFCPLHTWQLLAMCSPHGASVGFARLAEMLARRLREETTAPANGDAVRRLVRNSKNCRVCGLLRQAEAGYIRRMAALIDGTAGRNRYQRSQGVCLRHLGMLMDIVSTTENRKFLLSHAAQRFEEEAEDMRSYALKEEALRRELENRNEKDAYHRTIIRIAGGRNLSLPWPEDGEI
jgi:GTP-binding protein EngB required for normal cell division